jgi:hypothetical protein
LGKQGKRKHAENFVYKNNSQIRTMMFSKKAVAYLPEKDYDPKRIIPYFDGEKVTLVIERKRRYSQRMRVIHDSDEETTIKDKFGKESDREPEKKKK